MNTCEVCGSTPVCKTGLCPACTIDLWTGRTELSLKHGPFNPSSPPPDHRLAHFKKPENVVQPLTNVGTGNRNCGVFLGIVVAERVLSNVFKDVVRAPFGNKGFDFWCNRGMKIDVKASCIRKKNNKSNVSSWLFAIRKNKIADHFLCIAFDDRQDLNPLHLWLIPRHKVNHLMGFGISQNTLCKWKKYELPINKTVACCDTLRP